MELTLHLGKDRKQRRNAKAEKLNAVKEEKKTQKCKMQDTRTWKSRTHKKKQKNKTQRKKHNNNVVEILRSLYARFMVDVEEEGEGVVASLRGGSMDPEGARALEKFSAIATGRCRWRYIDIYVYIKCV